MSSIFSEISLVDVEWDVARNIVSLGVSQDLFDDLSADPKAWALVQKVEGDAKPPPYSSRSPIIDRPFEEAIWIDAIDWPFKNLQSSRFGAGGYGVWYGSDSVETTVYESAYHWFTGLLQDAGFDRLAKDKPIIGERKVYWVACHAALLDMRGAAAGYPDLLHPSDYTFCQSVGARVHREGHPGLLTPSVRRPEGENYVVFNPAVLSKPRVCCQLVYRLEGDEIVVQRQVGVNWMSLWVSRQRT